MNGFSIDTLEGNCVESVHVPNKTIKTGQDTQIPNPDHLSKFGTDTLEGNFAEEDPSR